MGIHRRLAVLLCTSVCAAATPAAPFWPQASSFTTGRSNVAVASGPRFTLDFDGDQAITSLVRDAFERSLIRIFPHVPDADGDGEAAPGAILGLAVRISDPRASLRLGVDESYTLTVPTSGQANIDAGTVFGVYHAMETFSQLVSFNFTAGVYQLDGAPWHIEDTPRFPHRGLMVDTARHFQPVPALTAIIDAMTMAKLNVFHWHITDDQSWPAASRAHPEFAEKGSFSPSERYTWAEMKQVVHFARARGIRVVPEIDMPGHSASWSLSHPELFPVGCSSPALDPAKDSVYAMISDLLQDWADVFQDDAFHIGTDEVPEECWNNTADLAFMASKGLTSLDDLFGYFVHRVAGIAESAGKRPVVWDESLLRATPPKGATVQVWHCCSGDLVQQALDLGNDVIYSPDPWWYLDALADNSSYMYDAAGHATIELAKTPASGSARVLGGEACMWAETVDPSDLESTVWPRAAAIAEQLWSPAVATSSGFDSVAQARLEAFRCLMLQRGVHAGMATGDGRATPPGPGGCNQDGRAAAAQRASSSAALALV